MLQITVPSQEYWDSVNQRFVYTKEQTLQLEHSLVSLSKWESKWNKSFLHAQDKTDEETLDYIRCMTITQNVKPEVYSRLSADNIKEITEYINAPMTATTFGKDNNGKRNRKIITAEVIYSWMVALNVPPQYEKWHLNKLITLICPRLIRDLHRFKYSDRICFCFFFTHVFTFCTSFGSL